MCIRDRQGDLPVFKAPAGKVSLSTDKHTVSGKDFSVQFDSATGELAPVSYTHLDVYKRQLSGSRAAGGFAAGRALPRV